MSIFSDELKAVGQRERFRLAGLAVDLLLHIRQRLPGGLQPCVGDGVLHLHQQDAGVLRTTDAAEAQQQIFLAFAELAIHQHHRLARHDCAH